MSNTKRPSIDRKVTRTSEQKRQGILEAGVRFRIGDEVYEFTLGDVTPALAREFRRQMGASVRAVMGELNEDADLDTIGALIWLARRVRGEAVAFDDVVLSYADVEELEIADSDEPTGVDETNPEA